MKSFQNSWIAWRVIEHDSVILWFEMMAQLLVLKLEFSEQIALIV